MMKNINIIRIIHLTLGYDKGMGNIRSLLQKEQMEFGLPEDEQTDNGNFLPSMYTSVLDKF